MLKRFSQAMEKIEGLINLWSAPSADCSRKVLVAVSGGVDSMCLADVFLQHYGADVFDIAHCNFCLRGEESDADEALVRDWALQHGVLCHVKSFDTEAYAVEQGVSIEMAARDLRYEWFAALCGQYGYSAVAVAHNANDNAETLILNLMRGTGLHGLSGMSLVSRLPVEGSGVPALIRPLLECPRKMIEGYAFAHGIRYREDSTNALSDYKRNRIRNEVFPIFERINPSFVRTLNREMGYFSEAAQIVDDYCGQIASHVCNDSLIMPDSLGYLTSVSIPAMLSQKHWRYLLYYILEPYGFNSATIASIEELLESGRTISGKCFESATHVAVIERTALCVREIAGQACDGGSCSTGFSDSIMPVHGPGIYNFNGQRWQVDVIERDADMPLKQPEGIMIADADRLTFPFVCRKWREGDWMIPFGMKGRKKISDIFADKKYTSVQKEQAVMIVDCKGDLAEKQHVAGVLGFRMDDRYKVSPATTSIVRLAVLPTMKHN